MRPPLCVNVPTQVIYVIVRKHEGLREDSESLPDLVELDEDGYEWTAVAVPPTTSEESTEEGSGYVEDGPTSVTQVGAPSPPPPETTPPTRLGSLTPPTQMRNLMMSPIENDDE